MYVLPFSGECSIIAQKNQIRNLERVILDDQRGIIEYLELCVAAAAVVM